MVRYVHVDVTQKVNVFNVCYGVGRVHWTNERVYKCVNGTTSNLVCTGDQNRFFTWRVSFSSAKIMMMMKKRDDEESKVAWETLKSHTEVVCIAD